MSVVHATVTKGFSSPLPKAGERWHAQRDGEGAVGHPHNNWLASAIWQVIVGSAWRRRPLTVTASPRHLSPIFDRGEERGCFA